MTFHTSFIDFDNTLYHTHGMVLDVIAVLHAYGIAKNDIEETLDRAVHGATGSYFDYTFDRHLALLRERGYDIPSNEIASRLSDLLSQSYQYPDAEAFLRRLKHRSERLVLLTAGNEAFQRQKIAGTNLARFFDSVQVIHEKKDEYVARVEQPALNHLFVNDNLRENICVRDACPNVIVVTKRHPVKYTDEELRASGIPYFDSLTDIAAYVERIS